MKQALAALGMASLCAMASAAPAAAQQGNVAQIFYTKVKAGAQAQYEAGRRGHEHGALRRVLDPVALRLPARHELAVAG